MWKPRGNGANTNEPNVVNKGCCVQIAIANQNSLSLTHKPSMHMSDWQDLINKLRQFNEERNWAQFHNAEDLALALSIEAAEFNELFRPAEG